MIRLIIIGTLPESLLNFRGELIKSLIAHNCKVTAMSTKPDSSILGALSCAGVGFKEYSVQRNGLNPKADLITYLSLRKYFSSESPNIILAYTIKPIIWGGLASRVSSGTKFYGLITGLGFAFQGDSLKRRALSQLVSFLYRISLKHADRVIFQNSDNLEEFVSRRIIPAKKCALVNGSGVDLAHYAKTPLPIGNPIFLAIGRLLGEKGFREYAKAAEIVKTTYPNVVFRLLGPEDSSPDGIPLAEVQRWQSDGSLEYLESTSDVRPYIQDSHVFVLPSYHEGMPRVVLEAMAIGRPILTTDVPGCRETVISGENGYLVPKADAVALAERMIWFIENRDQWVSMGKRSRELAEGKYDVHKINARLMEIMGL